MEWKNQTPRMKGTDKAPQPHVVSPTVAFVVGQSRLHFSAFAAGKQTPYGSSAAPDKRQRGIATAQGSSRTAAGPGWAAEPGGGGALSLLRPERRRRRMQGRQAVGGGGDEPTQEGGRAGRRAASCHIGCYCAIVSVIVIMRGRDQLWVFGCWEGQRE